MKACGYNRSEAWLSPSNPGWDKVSREGELESISFLSQPTYVGGVLKVFRIELLND
jgi:hypothetical protein